jgi:hypothetical protein
MATCSTCGASFDNGSPFCSQCGSLPQQSKRFLYGGSLVLGFGLLAFAVMWGLFSHLPPEAATQAVKPKPPDDAAVLIANCGQPDTDQPDSKNPTLNRSLLFAKARVKAVFVRPDSAADWKMQAMLDSKTLKPLTPERLAKRLPCALPKPGSEH